jgi:hypothetical protein
LVSMSAMTLPMASISPSTGFPDLAFNKAMLIMMALHDFLFYFNFSIFLMVANDGDLAYRAMV